MKKSVKLFLLLLVSSVIVNAVVLLDYFNNYLTANPCPVVASLSICATILFAGVFVFTKNVYKASKDEYEKENGKIIRKPIFTILLVGLCYFTICIAGTYILYVLTPLAIGTLKGYVYAKYFLEKTLLRTVADILIMIASIAIAFFTACFISSHGKKKK